ncbi:hypothetical protein [Kitasatospora sp. NPDC101183]|uniref:hypothetical protein n=1 Tax=Kitasatospora sp. NPDC101183 TaxID=3364100 RepID=UPI0038078AEA
MSTPGGRQVGAEERQERERAWSIAQKERERAFDAAMEQRRAEVAEEALVSLNAQERQAWATGKRGSRLRYLEVATPDGEQVRIAVIWLGRFRAARRPLKVYDPLDGVMPDGEGVLLLLPIAAFLGLNFGIRWSFLRLIGRPCWAVAAAAGDDRGKGRGNVVVLRTRRRDTALRRAAALAGEVERTGRLALLTPLTPR